MTDKELLIECAKLDEFEWFGNYKPDPAICLWAKSNDCVHHRLPNYITSYDAIIPLIKKVLTTEEEQTRFNYALTETLKADGINTRAFGWTWLCNAGATPRQLAISLLKSKGIKV